MGNKQHREPNYPRVKSRKSDCKQEEIQALEEEGSQGKITIKRSSSSATRTKLGTLERASKSLGTLKLKFHRGAPTSTHAEEKFCPIVYQLPFIAISDHTSSGHGDITYQKGQRMTASGTISQTGWWFVELVGTGEQGYAPLNSVAPIEHFESLQYVAIYICIQYSNINCILWPIYLCYGFINKCIYTICVCV